MAPKKGRPLINRVGHRYGKLTVIEFHRPSPGRNSDFLWNCICDCGKKVTRSGSVLRAGKLHISKSCDLCTPKEELTGRRVGKLVVLSYRGSERKKNGMKGRLWNCICDCGKEVSVSAAALNSGNNQSCGCGRLGPRQDLIGEKFGKLTVVGYKERHPTTRSEFLWDCVCDCGEKVVRPGRSLTGGNNQSCGCLRKARRVVS